MDKNNILALVKSLYPPITGMYTDEELLIYIDICIVVVVNEGSGLTIPQQELACALLVLDMCLSQTIDGMIVKSKEIKDAKIGYGNKSTSRWKNLYDSLISGSSSDDTTLIYRGL